MLLFLTRGKKNWLKRLNAPKHWYLDKLSGCYAPKPSSGPHKYRECLPLVVLLRNKLKYAFISREVSHICRRRSVKVDGKIRIDTRFPVGFQDVVTFDKTGENFRLLYDTKGRFVIHRITPEEAGFKLCRVRKVFKKRGDTPYLTTHDGRTIRFPDPLIKTNDTVKLDLKTGKILDFAKFELNSLVMITSGANLGRMGHISKIEKHIGGFDIVHVTDARGHSFATRLSNAFVMGKGDEAWVSLQQDAGIKLSLIEDRERMFARRRGDDAEAENTAETETNIDEHGSMEVDA